MKKSLAFKFLYKIIIILFSLLMVLIPYFLTGCSCNNKNNLENVSKDLCCYTINASFNDENKTLTCNQTVDYINSYDVTLNEIQFHLYPNAFNNGVSKGPVSASYKEKAYPNGESFGNISINKVTVNNEEQNVNVGNSFNEVLYVSLNGELYPNDRVFIYMEYEVVLPNCLHRFGYGENTYNFGNFFPIASVYENGEFYFEEYESNGDPFYSETANYIVNIECEGDFIVASSGEQTKNEVNEQNKRLVTCEAKCIRDFAFVLSKKYQVISGKTGDVTVFYYYYDDDNAQKSLQAGIDSIKTFSELFGKYPYSTFTVAKTNFIHGGMEYPNLVFISDSIDEESEYLNVIIHETAHQWWYSMVGNNECEYAWIDEGLTEYSTLMFYRSNSNYNVDIQDSLNNSLSSYLLFSEICTSVYGSFDSSMTRNINAFRGDMEYVYITYVKGVLFFDNLEELIGNKSFLKGLRIYFDENCFKNATPSSLISAFQKGSKRNLESFFDSWVNGKVVLQNYNS